MKSDSVFVAALVAALVSAASPIAFAGDTLFLKSGNVVTESVAARWNGKLTAAKSYFVVQFQNHINAEDRRNLVSLGARIVRYIPDDAVVIYSSGRIAQTIEHSSSSIHAVIPFAPEWKVDEALWPSVFTGEKPERILVRLFPHEDGKKAAKSMNSISGVKVEREDGRSLVIRAKRAAIDRLAAIHSVEWLQIYPKMRPLHFDFDESPTSTGGDYKDLTGTESGTKLMNFAGPWSRGFTGTGQIVAMADTGLDMGEISTIAPDFAGRVPVGHSFGLFAKTWEDPMGHGTHVAGSVMGSGAASGGQIKGGAYGSNLVPQGMWSPVMDNLTVPPKLSDMFAKAYDAGARIHTNSWGSPRDLGAYDGFAQQVDEYMATHPDLLIVFAAGNSGVDANKDGRIDGGSVSSPGTAKNALTVGASKNYVMNGGYQKKLIELAIGRENWGTEPLASSMLSENAQGLAPFSSRGPTKDGRLKPEIVAPGTNILSARSHHKEAQPLWGAYSADYVWSGGTSMATPLAAGAAAVVRQYLANDRKIMNPSAALVKAALMHSAFDLFPGQFGEVGQARGQELMARRPNMDEGYGRVDVERATDLGRAVVVDERVGLSTGEMHTFPVTVSGNGKITATLVYTDAAAAAGSAKTLVNNLDLVLVSSSGQEVGLNDTINNSEMIEREIAAGKYEIRVKATNVPQGLANGRQPYALIVSIH